MPNEALTAQFLDWIGESRSYDETFDAWRTSCPRLTIWEDAMGDGLVERVRSPGLSDLRITVTTKGREFLAGWQATKREF